MLDTKCKYQNARTSPVVLIENALIRKLTCRTRLWREDNLHDKHNVLGALCFYICRRSYFKCIFQQTFLLLFPIYYVPV